MPPIVKMILEARDWDPATGTEEELRSNIKQRTTLFNQVQLGKMMETIGRAQNTAKCALWRNVNAAIYQIEMEELEKRDMEMGAEGELQNRVEMKLLEQKRRRAEKEAAVAHAWRIIEANCRAQAEEEIGQLQYMMVAAHKKENREKLHNGKFRRAVCYSIASFFAFIVFLQLTNPTRGPTYKVASALAGLVVIVPLVYKGYKFGDVPQMGFNHAQLERQIENRTVELIQKEELLQDDKEKKFQAKLQKEEEERVALIEERKRLRASKARKGHTEEKKENEEAEGVEESKNTADAQAVSSEEFKASLPELPVLPDVTRISVRKATLEGENANLTDTPLVPRRIKLEPIRPTESKIKSSLNATAPLNMRQQGRALDDRRPTAEAKAAEQGPQDKNEEDMRLPGR